MAKNQPNMTAKPSTKNQLDRIEAKLEALEAAVEPPVAFDIEKACQKLGGVKRSTIYRMLHQGRLSRIPDVGRVLITRKSIEKLAAS